jgi:hypothetical protein
MAQKVFAAGKVKRPKVLPPLNAECTRVLCVIVEGGRIEARRTYPHKHIFWLLKSDGHKYAQPASDACVAVLLEHGLIVAVIKDHPVCDVVDYHATPLGKKAVAAQSALPAHDDNQLDLLGGAA